MVGFGFRIIFHVFGQNSSFMVTTSRGCDFGFARRDSTKCATLVTQNFFHDSLTFCMLYGSWRATVHDVGRWFVQPCLVDVKLIGHYVIERVAWHWGIFGRILLRTYIHSIFDSNHHKHLKLNHRPQEWPIELGREDLNIWRRICGRIWWIGALIVGNSFCLFHRLQPNYKAWIFLNFILFVRCLILCCMLINYWFLLVQSYSPCEFVSFIHEAWSSSPSKPSIGHN